MSKLNRNQAGFSAMEAILIVVIAGVIGSVGWYVWQAHDQEKTTVTTAADISVAKPHAPDLIGNKLYVSKLAKLSFSYPKNWSVENNIVAGAQLKHGGNDEFRANGGGSIAHYDFAYYDNYTSGTDDIDRYGCSSQFDPMVPCNDDVVLDIQKVDIGTIKQAYIITYYVQDPSGEPQDLKTVLHAPESTDTLPVLGLNKHEKYAINYGVPRIIQKNDTVYSNRVVFQAVYHVDDPRKIDAKSFLSSPDVKEVYAVMRSVKFAKQ